MVTSTVKLCGCGCGEPAPIATITRAKYGWVKGRPTRFVHNHHHRLFDTAAAFWSKVDKSPGHGPKGDCWVWTGFTNDYGYGILTIKQRRRKAHRIAWELTHGSADDTLEICHSCDNPPCVRPEHLFTGTHADNMADMASKGRNTFGERHPAARLTDTQVAEIRGLVAGGVLQKHAARQFGVGSAYVSELVSGRKRGRRA
jgi:hypothetical protein